MRIGLLSPQGNIIVVMPLILVLVSLGTAMWGYQQMLTSSSTAQRSRSENSLIANNIMRRIKTLLGTPGIQAGPDNCGAPGTAGTLNYILAQYRDLRVGNPGQVTLSYPGNLASSTTSGTCLLPSYELPGNGSNLATVTVTINQIQPPDFSSLTRGVSVQIDVANATSGAQNNQLSTYSVTRNFTLRVASMSHYAVILRNPGSNTPKITANTATMSTWILGRTYYAGANGTTYADSNFYSYVGSLIFERPVDFRGKGFSFASGGFQQKALSGVFRGGMNTRVLSSVVSSVLPFEDPGISSSAAHPATNAWQHRVLYTQQASGVTPFLSPWPDVVNEVNIAAAFPGGYSPPTANNSNVAPATTYPFPNLSRNDGNPVIFAGNLVSSCQDQGLATTVMQRMDYDATINYDTPGNNGYMFCALIAAKVVNINLPAAASNTLFWFIGQINAAQINVTSAGANNMLIIANPFDEFKVAPTFSGSAAGMTVGKLAKRFRAQAAGPGRNFFVPIFRYPPPARYRASRFRPSATLSVRLAQGTTSIPASAASQDTVAPSYVSPCTVTQLAIPSSCGTTALGWLSTDPIMNTTSGIYSTTEIRDDLFGTGTFLDNLVFNAEGDE